MNATEEVSRTQLRSALLYLIGIFLFLIFVARWYLSLKHTGGIPFMDAKVYSRAIATWHAGGDPYSTNSESLPFVYPPVFLKCMVILGSLFPQHIGWYVYLSVDCLSLLAIPWLLTIGYVRSQWLTPFVAMLLFIFQPTFIEEYVFLTGNIANLFYPLALAAGILGIRRNKWLFFYLVVAVASLSKLTFLDLLILPLLAGERQLGSIFLCAGMVLSTFPLQRIFMPHYYAAFQQNVFTEVFTRGDAGFNIFNYLHKQGRTLAPLRNPFVLFTIHLAIIGTLLAGFFLAKRCRKRLAVADLWVPALLVLVILANPRMQHIDADIAIIPAIYLCIECIRRIHINQYFFAGIALASTAFEFLLVKQFEMGLLILLYGSVLLVLFLLLREATLKNTDAATAQGAISITASPHSVGVGPFCLVPTKAHE
jgi:hypothetical protein